MNEFEEEKKELPFAEVLTAVFQNEDIPIHLIYRFSDLSDADAASLDAAWSAADAERQQAIVRHMADIAEESYLVNFYPTFAKLLKSKSPDVRRAALDGLWDCDDIKLIQPIVRLMQADEVESVQATAAATLTHYVLMAEWGELPERILPPLVEALLATYDDPETAVSVRCAALEALGGASHPRIASLIRDAYESDDPRMQQSALFAMGSSADPQWLPLLIAEMESDVPEMRAEAARAAGTIGKSDAVPELAELATDPEDDVALAAVVALGQIGGEQAQALLESLLNDEEFEERHEAIEEAIDEMGWLDDINMPDFSRNHQVEEKEEDASQPLIWKRKW